MINLGKWEGLDPVFQVRIWKENLSLDVTGDLISFRYEDCEDEVDLFEVVLFNHGGVYSDSKLFQEGNEIEIAWGYATRWSDVKIGTIKKVTPSFTSDGMSLSVTGLSRGSELMCAVASGGWRVNERPGQAGIRPSTIARILAEYHGFDTVDPWTKEPTIEDCINYLTDVEQHAETDWEFLLRLSDLCQWGTETGQQGFTFYVQDDVMHFHRPWVTDRPQFVFEYYTDKRGVVKSFIPKSDTHEIDSASLESTAIEVDPKRLQLRGFAANNVTSSGRTTHGKKSVSAPGKAGNEPTQAYHAFNDATGHFSEKGVIEIANPAHPSPLKHRMRTGEQKQTAGMVRPEFEAKPKTMAQMLTEVGMAEGEGRQLIAELKTIGIPDLTAKALCEMKNVGAKYGGYWYMKKVTHAYAGDGYECQVDLVKNSKGEDESIVDADAGGRPFLVEEELIGAQDYGYDIPAMESGVMPEDG